MTDVATSSVPASRRDLTRSKIVAAAAQLLVEGGRDAVTTRAVSASAGVQAPTIYRLFDDKAGLLDAVVEHGFIAYLEDKVRPHSGADPVEALRAGWDVHVGFGLSNPALYSLMYGEPRPGTHSRAADLAYDSLRDRVREIAKVGRLGLTEAHAVRLIHASACGTVFALLQVAEDERDMTVSTLARETCIAAVTNEGTELAEPGAFSAAIALRATVADVTSLTPAERDLLAEWLDRMTTGSSSDADRRGD